MSELPPLHLDARPEDADWIKAGSWDIPARNSEELREWLGWQQIDPADFKRFVVYRSNVERMPWLRDL